MSALKAIAETVVLDQILTRGFPVSQKSKATLGLQALAGLLIIVALGFLIAALHAWLITAYTPDIASLITAGAVFALALVAALAAYVIAHQRQARMAVFKHDMKNNIQTVIDAFDSELGEHVRANPATAVALAGLAGFILADRVL